MKALQLLGLSLSTDVGQGRPHFSSPIANGMTHSATGPVEKKPSVVPKLFRGGVFREVFFLFLCFLLRLFTLIGFCPLLRRGRGVSESVAAVQERHQINSDVLDLGSRKQKKPQGGTPHPFLTPWHGGK